MKQAIDALQMGKGSKIMEKAMPLYEWTLYPPGTDRKPRYVYTRREPPAGAAPPHAPMPTRRPPVIIFGGHEVHPSLETDWTLGTGDFDVEKALRQHRNVLVMNMLKSGRSAQFRSSGNSLWPMVKSGDVTIYEPVVDHSLLKVGEVVFCRVQTSNYFYAHMIHNIGTWDGVTYWDIGNANNPPHINGWCYAEHIFGRLMETSRVQPGAQAANPQDP